MTRVLFFLSAQKKTEKFVLRLTSEELISLVDLILSESELNSRDSPHDDRSSLDQVSCSLIQSRLPLLHSYCNGDLENIKKVSEYLINCTKKWEDRYVYISCHLVYCFNTYDTSTLSQPSICKETCAHQMLLTMAQPIYFHTLYCSS